MKKGSKNFYTIALKFWDQFNVNSVLFYLSSYNSIKLRHLYLKHVEKNNKQCIEALASLIFSKTFSILRITLLWHSKEIVHLLFCAFQTKLNKAVNIFCRLSEWIRNVQLIPGFIRRLRWERGWKSCIANSKDWRFEN